VLDFFAMSAAPTKVIVTNPAFACAMPAIEHALAIGFEVVIFLAKLSFLSTADRFERLHKPGHLRRVYILAERLHGMHDYSFLAAGGKTASQSQTDCWIVVDRLYRGPATIIPVSINDPTSRMPWLR
jgi:hypothetical protein